MKAWFFRFTHYWNKSERVCVGLAVGETLEDMWCAIDEVCAPSDCSIYPLERGRSGRMARITWVDPADGTADELPEMFDEVEGYPDPFKDEGWKPSPFPEGGYHSNPWEKARRVRA
jgi:hypothetical protein